MSLKTARDKNAAMTGAAESAVSAAVSRKCATAASVYASRNAVDLTVGTMAAVVVAVPVTIFSCALKMAVMKDNVCPN
jgi:hypothetical protein